MKKNTIITVVIALAVLALSFFAFQKPATAPQPTPSPLAVLTPTPNAGGVLIEGQKGTISNPESIPASPTAAPTPPSPSPSSSPEPSASAPAAVTINVTARQWVFEPATIRVKLGQKVTLNITSIDVTHGIAIPQFGVNANLQAGQVTTVTFTPDKTGSFTFFCSVFCGSGHRDMQGTLVVE